MPQALDWNPLAHSFPVILYLVKSRKLSHDYRLQDAIEIYRNDVLTTGEQSNAKQPSIGSMAKTLGRPCLYF